jgi:hypothetical protein
VVRRGFDSFGPAPGFTIARSGAKLELSYGEEVFENSLNILHVIDREGNVIAPKPPVL